jgi:xylulokinase
MDMADAAGTLLLDEQERDWSEELCAAAGIDRAILPPLYEGPEITGRIPRGMQRRLGFERKVKLVAGAGDAAAGALGIGAINDGDVMISLGTSGQYLRATSSYRPNPQETVHAFCHGLPDMWLQMGALLNGASCAGWAANLAGRGIDDLEAETARSFKGPSSALFLPYLQGERTPHNDPLARGVLFNMSADFDGAELLHCVMEGVAFSLRDAQECLGADTAGVDRPAWLVGGGARSRLWAQILANVLQKTIRTSSGGQLGPALGAARLARLACTGEDLAAVFAPPALEREFTPDAALAARYEAIYPRFRQLYRLLKPEFARAQAADQAAPVSSA